MNTLPPEIWLLIKDAIPLSDMRTHVSFYQAAPSFAALYDTVADPDAFWEDVCTMCAIGRFPDEHPSVRSWKDIAVECITVDGFCEGSSKHPCGEVLLQRNRESLCSSFALHDVDAVSGDMMHECALRNHKAAASGETTTIETNKLLRRDYYGDLAPEADKKRTHTLSIQLCHLRCSRTAPIVHPLCARSYATFPGIKHCVADGDWGRELRSSKLQSDYAITVHDVLRAIQAE